MDFGEGKNGESITEASSLGTLVGDYELVCGKRGGPTFTIRIPQQWRDFQGANELLSMKPKIIKGQGLQCLIVGNPFLQAVALTFDISRMMVVLSHLDVEGNRCAEYEGPKSIVSKEQSSLAAQPPNIRSNRLPIKDGKLVLPSLAQSSLSTSAPEKDTVPIATDVALDLRFMTYPSSADTSLVSVETRKATDLILPCLDVVVSNAQGASVFMSQIWDTGSGTNLLMDIDMSTTEVCPEGQCFCERGGLVGNALGKTSLLGGASSSCGPCNQPNVGSKQGDGGGVCNSFAARQKASPATARCRVRRRSAPASSVTSRAWSPCPSRARTWEMEGRFVLATCNASSPGARSRRASPASTRASSGLGSGTLPWWAVRERTRLPRRPAFPTTCSGPSGK